MRDPKYTEAHEQQIALMESLRPTPDPLPPARPDASWAAAIYRVEDVHGPTAPEMAFLLVNGEDLADFLREVKADALNVYKGHTVTACETIPRGKCAVSVAF